MGLTWSNKNEIIVVNPNPILVDYSYDVENGFLGLKRDIILRLCNFLWNDMNKVKTIFGACSEHCTWKKHLYFVEGRPIKIPVLFRPNPKGQCTCTNTSPGEPERVLFEVDKSYRTVFQDHVVSEGIFRWTVKISYGENESSYFWLGAAMPERLSGCDESALGFKAHGSWSFCFSRKDRKKLQSNLFGMRYSSYVPRLDTPVPDDSVVAVEANSLAQTLMFFVNGKRLPHAFSRTPYPLYLGVSACAFGRGRPSVTSLAFCRLSGPTPSSGLCKLYECKLD